MPKKVKGATDKMTPAGKKLFAEIAKLVELEVESGFTSGKQGYDQSNSSVNVEDYDNGTTIAEVAAYNEFGTKNSDGSQRIPERPFMRQSVEKNEDMIGKVGEELFKQFAQGKLTADEAIRKMGALQVGLIQKEIRDGGFAENDAATIKRKDSSKPLIDTAHMMQSIHYVVKPRKG